MQRGDRDVSSLSLPPAGPNAHQKHIKVFVPRAGQAATQSSRLARTWWHHEEGRERQRGMLTLSNQAQSSLSISCPPSHLGVIFRGVSVSSGVCWRGMHRQEGGRRMGSATQTRTTCPKGTWTPGDGQRAGQGAGTACVLGQGHRCHHILVSSPGASPGADVPQGCVRGSGATEQAAGSALWVDGKG